MQRIFKEDEGRKPLEKRWKVRNLRNVVSKIRCTLRVTFKWFANSECPSPKGLETLFSSLKCYRCSGFSKRMKERKPLEKRWNLRNVVSKIRCTLRVTFKWFANSECPSPKGLETLFSSLKCYRCSGFSKRMKEESPWKSPWKSAEKWETSEMSYRKSAAPWEWLSNGLQIRNARPLKA